MNRLTLVYTSLKNGLFLKVDSSFFVNTYEDIRGYYLSSQRE